MWLQDFYPIEDNRNVLIESVQRLEIDSGERKLKDK